MARARVINPRLLDSPLLGKLGPAGGFFFVGMILLSDDAGRLRGDIIYLKRSIMGGCSTRIRNDRVQHWINILHQSGTTYPYTDEAGGEFIQIANWSKYQKLSHPTPSKIPAPTPDQIPEIVRSDSGAFPPREKRREGKGGGPLVAAQPSSPTPQSEPHTSPAPAPPAGTPSAPAAARPAPTPVEPPAPRWTPPSSPPPGARPAPVAPPPSMNSPERMRLLLDTCLATSHDNRDFGRPWLNRTFGSMFNRLRGDEQVALEREFTARYGYGIDTGPQGHRTPVGPTNGTGEGGDRTAGVGARSGAGTDEVLP